MTPAAVSVRRRRGGNSPTPAAILNALTSRIEAWRPAGRENLAMVTGKSVIRAVVG